MFVQKKYFEFAKKLATCWSLCACIFLFLFVTR